MWAHGWPDDGTRIFTVADEQRPIACAKGLTIVPDHTWETAAPPDVLIYPGGRGTRAQVDDPIIHERLVRLHDEGVLLASVCTGSLVFAAAGLLDGRPATTHWGSIEILPTLGRDIEVREADRFVDDGDIITASGVSAGIDMALHLVRRLHGPERARQVRRAIQYDPEPPV